MVSSCLCVHKIDLYECYPSLVAHCRDNFVAQFLRLQRCRFSNEIDKCVEVMNKCCYHNNSTMTLLASTGLDFICFLCMCRFNKINFELRNQNHLCIHFLADYYSAKQWWGKQNSNYALGCIQLKDEIKASCRADVPTDDKVNCSSEYIDIFAHIQSASRNSIFLRMIYHLNWCEVNFHGLSKCTKYWRRKN